MTSRRAGIYVRISDDKAGEAQGVARQEADCRALAERRGWTVGAVYTENDTSAFKRRRVHLPDGTTALRVVRPAFRQMLEELASGAVDAVIAYDLDRIARQPRDLEDLIDVVEARGIPTTAVTGDVDLSTESGIFMARMMVNVANKASRDTSRRVVRKQQELAEQGKSSGGGIRSFGYERDGRTVRETEAKVLRDVAAQLLGGASLNSLAKWLQETGVPTVQGGTWHPRSVHAVIGKPRIAGLRVYRGEIVGTADWPAILDRETWERVVVALDSRRNGSTNILTRWLCGILTCSACGQALQGGTNNFGGRYWCNSRRGGCGAIAINQPKAEQVVSAMLLAYLKRPDVLTSLQALGSRDHLSAARDEAVADEEQLRELAKMWAARDITTAEYMQARKDIEGRLAQWQGVLRAGLPAAAKRMTIGNIEETWEHMSVADRREVARIVFPHGIRVDASTRSGLQGFDPRRIVPVKWVHAADEPAATAS